MNDIVRRLAEGVNTREQFYAATTMIAAGNPARFCGSGFFVAEVSSSRPFVTLGETAPPYLVTSRHVVAPALHDQEPLVARVPTADGLYRDIALSQADWHHEGEVSIICVPRLRYEPRPGGAVFTVIAKEQFFSASWGSGAVFEVADPVRMFGLWSGDSDHPQLIVRTGTLALATIDPVQFKSGSARVYLVDGIVTRGMSGGPACITRGRGLSENALIGLIFGFYPYDDNELDAAPWDRAETDEQRIRRALRAQVGRLNMGLSIIVPVHEIAELLFKAGWSR